MFSYAGDYVLDPFGGSFTSMIAAVRLDRIGVGIELNKEMFGKSGLDNLKKTLIPDIFKNKELKISEFDYE